MNRVFVYDVEVFPNYISFIFVNFEDYLKVRKDMGDMSVTKDKRSPLAKDIPKFKDIPYDVFEISDVDGHEVNHVGGLMAYTSQNDYLAGFNSLSYDNIILNFILMNASRYRSIPKLIKKVYELSKKIVETPSEMLYKDESYTILKRYNGGYKSIDVQKILALDKIFKSLKQTLINLKWWNILDYHMPAISDIDRHHYTEWETNSIQDWDRLMMKEYVDGLIHYNVNDVLGTCEIFYFILDDIGTRFDIAAEYGLNVLSASDSKIGDVFFRKYYTEAANVSISHYVKGRTYRKAMKLSLCVHESVHFRTKEFKDMLTEIQGTTVYSTLELNIKFVSKGVTYNIKSGGLHSVDYPGVYLSTKDMYVWDVDVDSYYPSLIINGRVKPKHLSDVFFDVFKTIVNDRLAAKAGRFIKDKIKAAKNLIRAAILKITANGVYGKFNFEFGPLYDPLCTLQTTITGQLQLLMLVERITMVDMEVISVNTDGIVSLIPTNRLDEFKAICEEWQRDTSLNLEHTKYPLYIRRDVNNYFTVKDMDDPYKSIKAKGELDEFRRINYPKLQKGYNAPIVAHAIQKYFIEGKPAMETLREHTDIYDFCKTTNIGKKFGLQLESIKDGQHVIKKVQRNTRYFVSKGGGTLYKKENFGKKKAHMCKGHNVTIFNQFYGDNIADYNIDYTYYSIACNNMINKIKTGIRSGGKAKKQIRNKLDQGSLF